MKTKNLLFRGSQSRAAVCHRAVMETFERRQLMTAITVTTVSDAASHSGVSLRDAIAFANIDSRGGTSDTISFAAALAKQKITLSQGVLEIGAGGAGTGAIAITTSSGIVVSGAENSGDFVVDTGVHLSLTGLTIQDAYVASGNGGGIANAGTLTLTNCTLTNDLSDVYGGGLYNSGVVSVLGGRFSFDDANNSGGGFFNAGVGASLSFSGTQFINDAALGVGNGGAAYNQGTLSMGACVFSGNGASLGGAIENVGTANLNHCTFTGNSATTAGGIFIAGATSIQNSTFTGNSAVGTSDDNGVGGAIDIDAFEQSGFTVANCTFSDNSAQNGGAIYSTDVPVIGTIGNCTIVGNSAATGGGIFFAGYNGNPRASLENTIVGGNSATLSAPDVADVNDVVTTNSSFYNLIGDGTGSKIKAGVNGNQVGTAANPIAAGVLGPDNYGGQTQSAALTSNSPARHAGGRLTTLTAAITATTLTLPVALVTAIASTSGNFAIQIDGEQILVTGVNLAAHTVSGARGYNGTTAAVHASGAKISWANDQTDSPRPTVSDIGAYQYKTVSSAVTKLPATETVNNFSVSWTGKPGTDGVAVANYSVYVSDNNGPYTLWENQTAATSAYFAGVGGHTYRFYSIATDTDGNVQPTPTSPQAVTTVQLPGSATVQAGGTGYSEAAGTWAASSMTGYNNTTSRYSGTAGATARWTPVLSAGTYTVQFFNVVASGDTTNAKISILHSGVTTTTTIDQANGVSGLVTLGTFTFTGSGSEYVSLTNLSGGLLRTNAVLFTKVS